MVRKIRKVFSVRAFCRPLRAGIPLLLVSACGDAVGPDPGDQLSLQFEIVSGLEGSHIVHAGWEGPIQIQITDADGNPFANQPVSIELVSGSATVDPASVYTDSEGRAEARLAIDSDAPMNQHIRARISAQGEEETLEHWVRRPLVLYHEVDERSGTVVVRSHDRMSGQDALISDESGARVVWDVSPDGALVLYSVPKESTGFQLRLYDFSDGSDHQIAADADVHYSHAEFSQDGEWVSYSASLESGPYSAWVEVHSLQDGSTARHLQVDREQDGVVAAPYSSAALVVPGTLTEGSLWLYDLETGNETAIVSPYGYGQERHVRPVVTAEGDIYFQCGEVEQRICRASAEDHSVEMVLTIPRSDDSSRFTLRGLMVSGDGVIGDETRWQDGNREAAVRIYPFDGSPPETLLVGGSENVSAGEHLIGWDGGVESPALQIP